MLSLTFTILPVFLLLIFGVILRRIRFPFDDFWSGVDKLVYWILFPAMLFNKTSQIDFNNPTLPNYALVLLVALFVTAVYIFAVNRAFKVDPSTASSMLQAGVRFNTFIVLAVAEALYPREGLAFAALGAAILIPTVNVFLVISMVLMHGNKQLRISQLLI